MSSVPKVKSSGQQTAAQGGALPLCLLLASLLLVMSVGALRQAQSSAQLSAALLSRYEVQQLTHQLLQDAYDTLSSDPLALPAPSAAIDIPPPALPDGYAGQLSVAHVTQDDLCPELAPATRHHYEITAVLQRPQLRYAGRLGMSLCISDCPGGTCTGALGELRPRYWNAGVAP